VPSGRPASAAQGHSALADTTPPAAPINLTADPASWSNRPTFTVTWTNPADPSGINGAYWKLNTPPTHNSDGTLVTGVNLTSLTVTVPGEGQHTLYVWLRDGANNVTFLNRASVTLSYDATPPGPPFRLQVQPVGWVNTNNFTLTWSSPPDLSGIAGAYYRLDREPSAPDDGLFVTTTNTITGIQVPGNGQYDVYLWLKDNAGNSDTANRNAIPKAFAFDNTTPVASHLLTGTTGSNAWYTTPVTVTLTGFDWPAGVAEIRHQINGGAEITSTQFVIPDDGDHQLQYYAVDRAGNRSPAQQVPIRLDQTPPVTTQVISGSLGAGGWYTTPVTVNLIPTDTTSGVSVTQYRLDTSAWERGQQVAIGDNGDHQLEYYTTDQAGNSEAHQQSTIRVDWLPPTTTLALAGQAGANGWYTSSVTATFSAVDDASGLALTYCRVDDLPWATSGRCVINGDGRHLLTYYSIDQAGNQEAPTIVTVLVDSTPPVTAHTQPEGTPGASGWYVSPVTVTLLPFDVTSGVAATYYRTNQGSWQPGRVFVLTGDGEHLVEYYSQDNAGNREAIASLSARLDTTAPVSFLTINGRTGDNGWHLSPVTVSLQAQDGPGGSGLNLIHYALDSEWSTGNRVLITREGRYTLRYFAEDNAGNREITNTTAINLDLAAPPAPTALTVTPVTWTNRSLFTVTWTNPADFSGIAGAYVRLDRAPVSDTDGTFFPISGGSNGIGQILLPVTSDGPHDLYFWLRDRAGQTDASQRVVFSRTLWYDGTPPVTHATLTGSLGDNGWYRTPVTASFTATDGGSGVRLIRYRLDDNPWVTSNVVTIATDGRHTLEFYSEDFAGNREITQTLAVNLDRAAPAMPLNVRVQPSGWVSTTNAFTVTWTNPADVSGIVAACYKLNSPPAWATDGTLVTTTQQITGITVPRDGRHDLYLWLQDAAGNISHVNRAVILSAFAFDDNPPYTEVVRDRNPDGGNWYRRPVTLTFQPAADTSGIAHTYARLDFVDGFLPASQVVVQGDGNHVLDYFSVDNAGNQEQTRRVSIQIDSTPPTAWVEALPRHQQLTPARRQFLVSWRSYDGSGSDAPTYDVQYKDGATGVWTDWITHTTATTATFGPYTPFETQAGHTYYFRARARDLAGNQGGYLSYRGDAWSYMDAVDNGNFITAAWTRWTPFGPYRAITLTQSYNGTASYMAALGQVGCSAERGCTITNSLSGMWQAITIPPLTDMPAPTLSLWYRVYSYDVVWHEEFQRLYDSFDVTIFDQAGSSTLAVRDGNYIQLPPNGPYNTLYDTGWRHGLFDLTRWAGQRITLTLYVANREDDALNTWAFVDDIQVLDRSWINTTAYLPLVIVGNRTTGQSIPTPTPLPTPTPIAIPSGFRLR